MPDPLLPATIPIRLAAVLAGRSLKGFQRDLLPRCETIGGVSLAALERTLGVEFEPYTYLAAQRRLDATRTRERRGKAGNPARLQKEAA